MAERRTEALVGLMLDENAAAATITRYAEADLVWFAIVVAFPITIAG
ncbi:MAG: hypothetical protein WBR26_07600 [Candidatus Acidiferrum sp.]